MTLKKFKQSVNVKKMQINLLDSAATTCVFLMCAKNIIKTLNWGYLEEIGKNYKNVFVKKLYSLRN